MKVKRKIGRPRRYERPEEMEAIIDAYFQDCEDNNKPLTLSGLVLALGFSSRQSLLNYSKRSEDYWTLYARAKLRAEAYWERLLFKRSTFRAARFVLTCCFGWTDPYKDALNKIILVCTVVL